MIPNNEVLADTLEQAAEVIRQGWVQGDFRGITTDGKVGHCLLGGIRCATGYIYDENSDIWVEPLHAWMEVELQATELVQWKISSEYIDHWNDAPGRTQDEVVEVLLQTAKDLRNGTTP
jgi:hypothetical protein